MIQHEYETCVVLRPDMDDAVTDATFDKLEDVIDKNGGSLLFRDDWGKRRMAYDVQGHQRGHYAFLHHLAPPSLIEELERNIRIEESVLRFLTVKIIDDVDVELRIAQAAEQRRLREEAAQARAEQEEKDAAERAAAETAAQKAAAEAEAKRAAHADAVQATEPEGEEGEAAEAVAEEAVAAEAVEAVAAETERIHLLRNRT
jgi:small subunit ribosomal protein S6